MSVCPASGCDRPRRGAWCNMHRLRVRRHGSPDKLVRFADPAEAFLERTEPLLWDGHLIWTGAADEYGYGMMRVHGRHVPAHRYAWEREFGPIPDGMEVDHACRTPACVNVEHLRLATHAENMQYRPTMGVGSSSGYRNVFRQGSGFIVRIWANGESHYFGTHPTAEAASVVATRERARLHGEFAA